MCFSYAFRAALNIAWKLEDEEGVGWVWDMEAESGGTVRDVRMTVVS